MTIIRALYSHIPALILLAVPTSAWAAQDDGQLWLQANTSVPLDSNTRITIEQIARFSNRLDGLYTTEFGALVGQKVSKNFELGFGYRHVGYYNGNRSRDEDRFRQQVVGSFGRFSMRLRVDERLHPEGSEIGFRIRPLVRYNHPLGREGFAAFVSHESFVLPNSTRWGQKSGYERMRNWIGFVVPLTSHVNADVAYLNQYRFGRDDARTQMDHALSIQLNIDLSGVLHASHSSQGD